MIRPPPRSTRTDTLFPYTTLFRSTGGHCDSGGLPPSMDRKEPSVVDSPEEARRKVRWLHKFGARVIKICATGGVFSLGASVGAPQLTLEEMKAIADAGHMLRSEGRRVGKEGGRKCKIWGGPD